MGNAFQRAIQDKQLYVGYSLADFMALRESLAQEVVYKARQLVAIMGGVHEAELSRMAFTDLERVVVRHDAVELEIIRMIEESSPDYKESHGRANAEATGKDRGGRGEALSLGDAICRDESPKRQGHADSGTSRRNR